MKKIFLFLLLALFAGLFISCTSSGGPVLSKNVVPGALRLDAYKNLIEGKTIAIVANQTSMTGNKHLVDTLLSLGMKIKMIFAPEHGFRNLADAGESIVDGKDPGTGLDIVSLYGSQNKPTAENLAGVDAVLFDIQDVGTRFYTYLSTLTLVMESCAENGVKFIVLDRPNPNGFYFDGNILDTAFRSFVGLHPVPIAHGMTVGEYAGMVNGEGWLKGGIKCDLTIVRCLNWDHTSYYDLPVKSSPNLPNLTSVYLYPSLCFFEGTTVSCGRGTAFPFQTFGSPLLPDRGFSFTPESTDGAKNPLHLGVKCFGTDLRNAIKDNIVPTPYIHLEWVISAYRDFPDKDKFFRKYFDVLAGGTTLREQIQKGMTADEIRATWKDGLAKFGMIRSKYLLYK